MTTYLNNMNPIAVTAVLLTSSLTSLTYNRQIERDIDIGQRYYMHAGYRGGKESERGNEETMKGRGEGEREGRQ